MRPVLWIVVVTALAVPAFPQESTNSTNPPSSETTLTKAVEKAKDTLHVKAKQVKQQIADTICGATELDKALRTLREDAKDYNRQQEFMNKLVERCDQIRAAVTNVNGSNLKEALDRVTKGMEELIAFNESRAKEAETRAQNETMPFRQTWYRNLAESFNRCVRSYRNDLERFKQMKINEQIATLSGQIEYLNFLHDSLVSFRDQLTIVAKDQELIKSLEDLGKNIAELNKYLEDFSRAVLEPDIMGADNALGAKAGEPKAQTPSSRPAGK